MWNGGGCVLRLLARSGLRQHGNVRMHRRLLPERVLPAEPVRCRRQADRGRMRVRRQRVWDLCHGPGLREWRVQLRRRLLFRLLRERQVRDVERRPLRRRRGGLHDVPGDSGLQPPRQMRVHTEQLSQRMLRCERCLPDGQRR